MPVPYSYVEPASTPPGNKRPAPYSPKAAQSPIFYGANFPHVTFNPHFRRGFLGGLDVAPEPIGVLLIAGLAIWGLSLLVE